MRFKEIWTGRRATEAEKPIFVEDIHVPSWSARALRTAVSRQPSGPEITPRTANTQKVTELIDTMLEEDGAGAITNSDIRNQWVTSSEELKKQAQQPELPPDGDDPAA